jgi:hypothetical protein
LDSKTGVDGAQTPAGKAADGLKSEKMAPLPNNEVSVFGTTGLEEEAAIARSQARQDQGLYGKQFKNLRNDPLW